MTSFCGFKWRLTPHLMVCMCTAPTLTLPLTPATGNDLYRKNAWLSCYELLQKSQRKSFKQKVAGFFQSLAKNVLHRPVRDEQKGA